MTSCFDVTIEDRVAHLVVGVGGRHDRDVALRHGRGDRSVDGDVAVAQEVRIVLDAVDIDPFGHGLDEPECQAAEVDRQVHDDVAAVGHVAGADETCRFGEQVGFVVPGTFELGGDGPADADRFLSSPR